MAAELMLINPRRKRRVTRARRNPRRRMSALQAKYFAPGRKSVTRRRRRSRAVTVARSNPIRRRRVHHRRKSVMRVRRNPISLSTRGITSALMPAAIGAGGAFALNYLWSNVLASSIPATFQSGMMKSVGQIAAALGIGLLAGKAFGKSVGAEMAGGAITVILFNTLSSAVSGSLASSGGSTYSYSGSYGYGGMAGLGVRPRRRMGRYVGMNGNAPRGLNGNVPHGLNGMGRYVKMHGMGAGPRRGRLRGLGYFGPARTV